MPASLFRINKLGTLPTNEIGRDPLAQEGIEFPIRLSAIGFVELLISEVFEAGHERVAQQVTQPKQLFSEAMGIRIVFTRTEEGLIFQQSIQNIERFACGARMAWEAKTEYWSEMCV